MLIFRTQWFAYFSWYLSDGPIEEYIAAVRTIDGAYDNIVLNAVTGKVNTREGYVTIDIGERSILFSGYSPCWYLCQYCNFVKYQS